VPSIKWTNAGRHPYTSKSLDKNLNVWTSRTSFMKWAMAFYSKHTAHKDPERIDILAPHGMCSEHNAPPKALLPSVPLHFLGASAIYPQLAPLPSAANNT